MKSSIAAVALLLGGCASVSNYCEEHPRPCVLGTTAVVAIGVGIVAVHASSHNQVVVVQNPKP